MRRITIIVCALCACVSLVRAAKGPPPTTEQAFPECSTRVYDIRDMIMQMNDYRFDGVMGLPQGQESNVATSTDEPPKARTTTQPSRPELVKAVIDLVEETVDPDSWRDMGGTIGSIRELSGQLIITQSEENQKLVESIFRQLRENAGVVRVQADWVMLRPEQLSTVMKKVATKDRKHVESRAVDMEALSAASIPRMHAEMTCFGGQTISISSGRMRTVIYDQQAVVAQNAVAMSPKVKQVSDGAMLEITPTPISATDYALIDVHSKVAQWGEPTPVTQGFSHTTTRPGDRAITGVADSAVIDRLNVATQELKASTRIPLNQPILIGGMTMEPAQADGQSPQLYLILTVSLTAGNG